MQFSIPRPAAVPLPFAGLSTYGTGVLYVLAAGVALGTLGPVSNVAYGAGMGSPTFAALRATVGALVLLALAGRDERRVSLRSLSRREQALLAMTAGAQACLSLALFAAYGAMSVALVLAVYFSYPLLVCAASIALGRERLTPVRAGRCSCRWPGCWSWCSAGRAPRCTRRRWASRWRPSPPAARRPTSWRRGTGSPGCPRRRP